MLFKYSETCIRLVLKPPHDWVGIHLSWIITHCVGVSRTTFSFGDLLKGLTVVILLVNVYYSERIE